MVVNRTLDNIGILTYSMFLKKISPKTKILVHCRKVNTAFEESKYFILYVSSFTQH